MVVFGEGAAVEVEPLGAGVGDEEGGDGGACVVEFEGDGKGLGGEQGEERGV